MATIGPKKRYRQPSKPSKLQLLDLEINALIKGYDELDDDSIELFTDIPLSQKTLDGLTDANYVNLSQIQKKAIPLALRGQDVLGAAPTGSGKTLAFLVPLLELLYRMKWTNVDGIASLIISPTRELAYQTFNVLKAVGKYHDFSCGLIIGGKSVQEEARAIDKTNIIICTPGRLLQHMDETWNFHACNLKLLVLDEADRILDMGFSHTMKAILSNLPKDRQTMLFSATQTKSISSLVSLSLRDPIFVSAHEELGHVTPDGLEQFYVVLDEFQKLSFIWSFIKHHRQKILVFLQCCKQVRFFGNLFKKMRPGIPIFALCGRMGQPKRLRIYDEFCEKSFGVLFATDIAARGLDIPQIDWVVQLDCCQDPETYIHRVGRTARFSRDGKAVLVVRPSERSMIKHLRARSVPISSTQINEDFDTDITQRVQIEVASDGDMLASAKRAFSVYVKSFRKAPKQFKDVFNIESIDIHKLARSYGIPQTPRLRFLQRDCQTAKDDIKITDQSYTPNPEPKNIRAPDNAGTRFHVTELSINQPNLEMLSESIAQILAAGKIEHVKYRERQKRASKNIGYSKKTEDCESRNSMEDDSNSD